MRVITLQSQIIGTDVVVTVPVQPNPFFLLVVAFNKTTGGVSSSPFVNINYGGVIDIFSLCEINAWIGAARRFVANIGGQNFNDTNARPSVYNRSLPMFLKLDSSCKITFGLYSPTGSEVITDAVVCVEDCDQCA